ncbi:hypothetical protein AB1K89_09190 [Sporosarcina sp. 179-K 8C2 HS]|uniref:hypothetical protein n=1 Tax=Sporosarcina sp. 179-K 8C2 HS TaxID=3142387 RepID=UPI0039A2BAB3
MKQLSPEYTKDGINIHELVQESSVIHTNVGQQIVVVTEDKLELCLIKHQNTLKARNDWKTPVGIFLALSSSLVATEFTEFLTLPAETWQAFFILGSAITGIWSVIAIIKAVNSKDSGNISKIISELKKNQSSL